MPYDEGLSGIFCDRCMTKGVAPLAELYAKGGTKTRPEDPPDVYRWKCPGCTGQTEPLVGPRKKRRQRGGVVVEPLRREAQRLTDLATADAFAPGALDNDRDLLHDVALGGGGGLRGSRRLRAPPRRDPADVELFEASAADRAKDIVREGEAVRRVDAMLVSGRRV